MSGYGGHVVHWPNDVVKFGLRGDEKVAFFEMVLESFVAVGCDEIVVEIVIGSGAV